MYRYFCTEFIDFMLKGKNLTKITNLFSPKSFKDNDKIILRYIENGRNA